MNKVNLIKYLLANISLMLLATSCSNVSPTAYKRTPPMNLKFLNCYQDDDNPDCSDDQTIISNTKKSLSKYQNQNISIFDNFFTNNTPGSRAKATTGSVKKQPVKTHGADSSIPNKEPKKLGIENESSIEQQLNSNTHSKLYDKFKQHQPANDVPKQTAPSVPLNQTPATPAATGTVPAMAPAKPSPSQANIAPSAQTAPSIHPSAQVAKPMPTQSDKAGAPVSTNNNPISTSQVINPNKLGENVNAPTLATPVPITPVIPKVAPLPESAKPSSTKQPDLPTPSTGKSNTKAETDNTKSLDDPAAAKPSTAQTNTLNSPGQAASKKPSKLMNKDSSRIQTIAIPSQNFVRPKDIATGEVAFMYEAQSDDEDKTKDRLKKNSNAKKMQLVSATEGNQGHIVLSEENPQLTRQQIWKNKLDIAKSKFVDYFSNLKNKVVNVIQK